MTDLLMLEPPISQEDTPPSGTRPIPRVTLASIGRRFAAYTIDGAIVGAAISLLNILITRTTPLWWDFFVNATALILSQVYYLWAYSTSGQTPGKYVLQIKVASTDGTPLNWRRGILRMSASLAGISVFGLGYVWAWWDKKRQTWHDKVAGTWVILASVTPEQIQGSASLMPQRSNSTLPEFLRSALIVLYLFGIAAYIFLLMPPVHQAIGSSFDATSSALLSGGLDLYDEHYEALMLALNERVGPDDTIPSGSVLFETSYTVGEEEAAVIWLVIDVTYTGTCNSTPSDPCEALVDELAGIALDNYGRLDDLSGMRVSIVDSGSIGPVEWTNIPVEEKSLTIAEWRDELGR